MFVPTIPTIIIEVIKSNAMYNAIAFGVITILLLEISRIDLRYLHQRHLPRQCQYESH